jgi:hypothetical protein
LPSVKNSLDRRHLIGIGCYQQKSIYPIECINKHLYGNTNVGSLFFLKGARPVMSDAKPGDALKIALVHGHPGRFQYAYIVSVALVFLSP